MGKRSRNIDFEVNSDLTAKLGGLAKSSYSILKAALYPGAGLLADEIRKRASQHDRTGTLAKSITIAQMRTKGGEVNTVVFFAGYDTSHKSKSYPNGVPNAIKAAALESGTSKQKKTPFIRPAVNAVREQCNALMQAELDKQIEKGMQ